MRLSEKAQIEMLRKALITCGRTVGGHLSDKVSTEFLVENVPEEVRLVLEKLQKENESLKKSVVHISPLDAETDPFCR